MANFSTALLPGTITDNEKRVVRERLTAARTYYVATTGSDTANDGLSASSPFLTIQKAVDLATTLDTGGYAVTIQLADGTYTGAVNHAKIMVGGGTLTIQGNASTPTNVVLSVTSPSPAAAVYVQSCAYLIVKDIKITTTTSGFGIAAYGARVDFSGVDFGACAFAHLRTIDGGQIYLLGNYTISGGGPQHFAAFGGWIRIRGALTVTLSGTPNFTTAFATAGQAGTGYLNAITFAGTGATGVRYVAEENGILRTAGGGANYFPGNSAGSTPTGGIYQ